ncbi:MAG: META domain-containing protein [Rickettsiales bacterium]|jgi:heat shock protein HslJ|nr:META domain-containing protein [Rickettsiales bacterium]
MRIRKENIQGIPAFAGIGKIIAMFSVIGLLAGCGGTAHDPDVLKGRDFYTVQDGTKISLVFDKDGKRLHGKVVNSYNAPYEINGDNLSIGTMVSTRMMAIGNAAKVEDDYMRFMSDGTMKAFSLIEGVLTITDKDGKSVRFESGK